MHPLVTSIVRAMHIGDVSNHHPFFNEKNLSKLKIKC